MDRNFRHDGTSASVASALIRDIPGAHSAYNHLPDFLVWGETRGAVKKAVAVLGFGCEGDDVGPYRQIRVVDAGGRAWGTLGTDPETGRSSVRLDYILSPR